MIHPLQEKALNLKKDLQALLENFNELKNQDERIFILFHQGTFSFSGDFNQPTAIILSFLDPNDRPVASSKFLASIYEGGGSNQFQEYQIVRHIFTYTIMPKMDHQGSYIQFEIIKGDRTLFLEFREIYTKEEFSDVVSNIINKHGNPAISGH